MRHQIHNLASQIPSNEGKVSRVSDEIRLRRTTDLLESILVSATEFAIIATDMEFNVTLYNPTAEWMFHCPAKRALGVHVSKVHSQGGAETIGLEEAIEDVVEKGKAEYVVEWEQADLPRQYLRVVIMPMCDEIGRWTGYVLIAEDITVLKQTERAIQESAEKFRLTFEQATDAIFWINPDTETIINCNKAAEKLLQRTRYAIIGRPHVSLYPEERAKEYESALRVATEAGETYDAEIELVTAEAQTLAVRMTASLTNIGPTPIIQAMARDITAQRKVELSLREAKTAAERANRMKSQFLANVSHEIRTPLNGIIGFAEGILSSTTLQDAQGLAETVLRESEHLMGLINTLLDHAKIEAGKLELECLPFALDDMLETVVSSTHGHAWRKNLDLRIEMPGDVPLHILADPMRLRQILLNLVNNAIKFTNQGEIVIRVESVVLQDDWATIRFCVTDTGIGIPADKQETIFQGFTQADDSTTRKYGGTGLGVTICKEIVGLMGGEMGLQSKPGQGSTFWFTIDVGICNDLDATASETTGSDREAAITQRVDSRANILIAEDYPTNQEVVRIHLASQGHNVTIAEHGGLAVELCKKHDFDMIFMDVQMPVMDGLEAARRIRADIPGYAETPIIALTANGEIDTRLACMEAGMNDVVTKPVRRATLLAAVSAWLSKDEIDESPTGKSTSETPARADASPMSDDELATLPSLDDDAPPIDFNTAIDEFGGNRKLFDSVLSRFLDQARVQMDLLNDALLASDYQTLQAEAHKLKGGAANLTADALANAACKLSDHIKAGKNDPEHCRLFVHNITQQFKQLEAFVNSHTVQHTEPGASS